MSNETMARPIGVEGHSTASKGDHKYFDPKAPQAPEQILGVDTQAVIRLGEAATTLEGLPYQVSLGLHVLPDAVRIYPLIERMQSGEELKPEDVRQFREPIKKLSPELTVVDKLAQFASAVGVGIPARRAINRKIEREFPARAASAVDSAREKIASIEEEINFMANFENPREEFVSELTVIADRTKEAIRDERNERISRNTVPEPAPVPKGFFGFLTKVVRKIRNFFGLFNWKRNVVSNPQITAYDAAGGIEKTLKNLLGDKERTKQLLPMFSGLLDRIPLKKLPTREQLAFLAPEVLTSIFSAIPATEDDDELLESVKRNPHEFRFITKYKKNYKGYSLERAQRATVNLLPAIRDLLPTEGQKIRQVFESVKDLLQPVQKAETQATSESLKNKSSKLRNWLTRGYKKRKKNPN